MTAMTTNQLTLSLEPGVVERWSTLREYIGHRVDVQVKLQKQIAADMDVSPSLLSSKLTQRGDHRFTCDDLEGYIASTGDVQAIIEYLATKFGPGGDSARKARAIGRLESLANQLERELRGMKKDRE